MVRFNKYDFEENFSYILFYIKYKLRWKLKNLCMLLTKIR
jgi:hypothetical protein